MSTNNDWPEMQCWFVLWDNRLSCESDIGPLLIVSLASLANKLLLSTNDDLDLWVPPEELSELAAFEASVKDAYSLASKEPPFSSFSLRSKTTISLLKVMSSRKAFPDAPVFFLIWPFWSFSFASLKPFELELPMERFLLPHDSTESRPIPQLTCWVKHAIEWSK